MTSRTITRIAVASLLMIAPFTACGPAAEQEAVTDAALEVAASPAASRLTPETGHQGLLYGRVTMDDDTEYEGRIRWGDGEEALWGHYFNGVKDENRWAARLPRELLPKERLSFQLFGMEIRGWEVPISLARPFMARFGDVARIEPRGRDMLVTLKSGTEFELDRYAADDLADGVRVWDRERGVVDIGEWGIRSIEFIANPGLGSGPDPLHGTVHTRSGDFTGLLQWNREESLTSDHLDGQTADGAMSVRFDAIRSVERRGPDSSVVTRLDGGQVVLSGTPEVGPGNRGIYVDDSRYGRVLVSWDAFERAEFTPGGTGPGYGDFPAGHGLRGSVLTESGDRLAGRLVFDLDESETTETLDAPAQGVDYTIPFALIGSIVPARGSAESGARLVAVTLRGGEELLLEPAGDVGEGNAGILIFVEGRLVPEYVPWSEVEQVDLDVPPGA